jgi:hypothetical protein
MDDRDDKPAGANGPSSSSPSSSSVAIRRRSTFAVCRPQPAAHQTGTKPKGAPLVFSGLVCGRQRRPLLAAPSGSLTHFGCAEARNNKYLLGIIYWP